MIHFVTTILLSFMLQADSPTKPYEAYVFLHDECIISKHYTLALNELQKTHKNNVKFYGVFPNPNVDQARIKAYKEKYSIDFTCISDPDFKLTENFGATITPEVFVVRVQTSEIVYFGRIDNSYARVGRKRSKVTRQELKDVLYDLHSKGKTDVTHEPAIGCLITQINMN